MTSKPLTASVGVLAAALLVAGCQSRVGTAATVGSSRISTKALNASVNQALQSVAGKAAAKADANKFEGDVLQTLVRHQLILDLAAARHVVVSAGDVDTAEQALAVTDQTGSTGRTETDRRLAAQDGATVRALELDYTKTHPADSAQITVFQVKDQATANLALAALKANPKDVTAIGQKYATDPTAAQSGQTQLSSLPPEVQSLKPGQSAAVTVQGVIYVIQVAVLLDDKDLSSDLLTVAKVRVNPRFGAWDPKGLALVAAKSDVVTPASVAPSAAPSGAPGLDSGAAPSAAPSAAAPSS